MTESLKERETEVDRWKDGETHWIKQATGLHEEKKKKKIYMLWLVWGIIQEFQTTSGSNTCYYLYANGTHTDKKQFNTQNGIHD
jgi:hypothetical protein